MYSPEPDDTASPSDTQLGGKTDESEDRSPEPEVPLQNSEGRDKSAPAQLPSASAVICDLESLPVLLTPGEMATLLRTTKKAIYTMAERGLLPGIFRPDRRRLLFKRSEVLYWLNDRRASTPGKTRR